MLTRRRMFGILGGGAVAAAAPGVAPAVPLGAPLPAPAPLPHGTLSHLSAADMQHCERTISVAPNGGVAGTILDRHPATLSAEEYAAWVEARRRSA